ncbi:DUF4179 domain-containing protein [Candidatus Clostridium radicumherbarum]|uniref:DUF4179 domain-containing protein n=1 Tax=Candidatus Clostridium radicumherbarum TaxID=3381662 RepID=A0ABW8TR86_9CLOT
MSDDFINDGKKKYDTIPLPDDIELCLIRTLKKAKNSRKNKPIIKIIGGFSAALVVFILIVNSSPNLAYALNDVPILKNLVQLIYHDKGFNNLVNSNRFQQLNLTATDKGASFTVNSIVGDNSKLWIGYNFTGKGLFVGEINFRTRDDNKYLPWSVVNTNEDNNNLDVSIDKLVKDFIMDVQVYRDDPLFHVPTTNLSEETLKALKVKLAQSKLTTLSIPISLNNTVYKEDLNVLSYKNKEFKSKIGTFKIDKITLSESRSNVYCELLSNDYELINVESPRLVDKNGEEFDYPYNFQNLAVNNNIVIELEGGIANNRELSFKCDGIKYLNKKDKYITLDVKNKLANPNNLGVEFAGIEGNTITLNTTKGAVNFDFQANSKTGKNIIIDSISINSSNGKEVLKFKNIPSEDIILKVTEADCMKTDGFDLKLGD